MPNNEPKPCLNCRWHTSRTSEHGTSHGCLHARSFESKRTPATDLVTGGAIDIFERIRMCGTMREFKELCGHDAKLWEEEKCFAINNERERPLS